MIEDIKIEVARLDGYLTGVVSLNGKINEYYSGAFLIEKNDTESLEASLEKYFFPNCKVYLSSIKKLERGMEELELKIQDYIINNVLNISEEYIDSQSLIDRKKYISFKVMDMIDLSIINISDNPINSFSVYEVKAKFDDNTNFSFFCIIFDKKILVLQFKATR